MTCVAKSVSKLLLIHEGGCPVSVDVVGLLLVMTSQPLFLSFQTVYDAWFISFYNVLFTSAPIVFLAVLDQVGSL